MKATQHMKATALFSLGLACAATLSVIAGQPAAVTIALPPAVVDVVKPDLAVAMEKIPTVTIVGKRLSKAEKNRRRCHRSHP
ncbi:hypothetical protein ACFS07_23890 [Undibacterium arcticum]